MMTSTVCRLALTVALVSLAGCASEGEEIAPVASPLKTTAAAAAENPDREAWFGELHIHTTQSFDAFIMGVRTTPEEAYRFARGETVEFMGQEVTRKRPLDFMAITDHAEQMGLGDALIDPDHPLSQTQVGKDIVAGKIPSTELGKISRSNIGDQLDSASVWQRVVTTANRFNDPGRFTTFIAYEWSSMPNYANLHRNVIYRGDDAPPPFSALDSDRPEDLWHFMESNRARGYENLAIPHNANSSNGLMYDWVQSDGRPIDEAYAQRRALNEPLSEIAQTKGTSETTPELSPGDRFAEFELMRELMLSWVPGKQGGSYVRDALGRGLVIADKVKANPYKFGFIGSTDTHSGLNTVREDEWGGHVSTLAAVVERDLAARSLMDDDPFFETVRTSAGALAGVWAESNTRESLFDAMRRRETFATSGTRIKVRLFGGWDFAQGDINSEGWVRNAYRTGVPMGGDLPVRNKQSAPRFLVWAARDPDSVGLERAQIVKVWLDAGQHREKVFDVRVSDRKGGDALIREVWTDPAFDPDQAAVYYLRVLETESPRWSTLLARRLNLPIPKSVPERIQERAWSSPIWYSPTT